MKTCGVGFLIVALYASAALALDVDFSRRRSAASVDAESPSQPIEQKPAIPAPVAQESALAAPDEPSQMSMPPVAAPKTMHLPTPLKKLVSTRQDRRTVDRQSFVILNTAKGFIPAQVRVFKGGHYLVHVVNVNEEKKNVSFVLDAFKEHHSTYFGKIKTFELSPEMEGVYEFQCPETSAEGSLVVLGPKTMSPVSNRRLSSADESEVAPSRGGTPADEKAEHE